MPRKYQNQEGTAKLSLTLSPDAAGRIRRLADDKSFTLAELVRRAVGLYDFVEHLDEDEELCVINRKSGEVRHVTLLS